MQAEQRIVRVLKHWIHPPQSATGGSLDVRQLRLERAVIQNQVPMSPGFPALYARRAADDPRGFRGSA